MTRLNTEASIDVELLTTAASDLRFIDEVTRGDPDFDALRRLSVQMRLLINDDLLIKAWKNVGVLEGAPIIKSIRLDVVNADPDDFIFAGGGEYGGMRIAAFRHLPRAMTPDEIARRAKAGPPMKDFPLHEYKDSASAIVKGKSIKRHQIISFVAHKKGGAHLDRKRKKDDEAYMALDDLMTAVKIGGNGGSLKLHDPVSYELLSIAQAVSRSKDIHKLLAAIDKQLGQR